MLGLLGGMGDARVCHHARMIDSSWLDHTSSWWAKADRAQDHLRSLGRQMQEFRASQPYTVVPEPTDTPGRTAYRLRIHKPMPVAISTTVGDVLHNLRSALDSLAYEIARRGLGRPMTRAQEAACAFPVRETPEQFDQFFNEASKDRQARIRAQLYKGKARAALRSVQPFRIREEAINLGVEAANTYEEEYRWSVLHRLGRLSNIDKHRRLNVMVWWPELVYWQSNGPSNRRWLGGDGTFTDGSILGYMVGSDAGIASKIFHEFNLVLADDLVHDAGNPNSSGEDLVAMLHRWHQYITSWVFGRVFIIMSRDVAEFSSF
jgi:hypothetical protein